MLSIRSSLELFMRQNKERLASAWFSAALLLLIVLTLASGAQAQNGFYGTTYPQSAAGTTASASGSPYAGATYGNTAATPAAAYAGNSTGGGWSA